MEGQNVQGWVVIGSVQVEDAVDAEHMEEQLEVVLVIDRVVDNVDE